MTNAPSRKNAFHGLQSKEAKIGFEELSPLFAYDPGTGQLFWKINIGGYATVASEAGSINRRHGYRYVRYRRVSYLAHRIAWLIHYGAWPKARLDHRDGDGLNNKIDNLRECTASQNAHNCRLPKNNTSGFKGVSLNKRTGKWNANLRSPQGGSVFLGAFTIPQDAARAYDKAAEHFFGEFASHNASLGLLP